MTRLGAFNDNLHDWTDDRRRTGRLLYHYMINHVSRIHQTMNGEIYSVHRVPCRRLQPFHFAGWPGRVGFDKMAMMLRALVT